MGFFIIIITIIVVTIIFIIITVVNKYYNIYNPCGAIHSSVDRIVVSKLRYTEITIPARIDCRSEGSTRDAVRTKNNNFDNNKFNDDDHIQ